MNVCLLPVGACDDMAHSQNEKYNKRNLVNGIKVRGMNNTYAISYLMSNIVKLP